MLAGSRPTVSLDPGNLIPSAHLCTSTQTHINTKVYFSKYDDQSSLRKCFGLHLEKHSTMVAESKPQGTWQATSDEESREGVCSAHFLHCSLARGQDASSTHELSQSGPTLTDNLRALNLEHWLSNFLMLRPLNAVP